LKKLPNYNDSWGFKFKDATTGTIISEALKYVYIIAGLSLLVMLISGGIQLMTAAGDEAGVKAGYGKVKAGLIGFFIIFVSFFIVQMVQVIFGIKVI
jgi:hypothetical protein